MDIHDFLQKHDAYKDMHDWATGKSLNEIWYTCQSGALLYRICKFAGIDEDVIGHIQRQTGYMLASESLRLSDHDNQALEQMLLVVSKEIAELIRRTVPFETIASLIEAA